MTWIPAAAFSAVPRSLEEAARDAGASRARVFFTVTLRLALPGMRVIQFALEGPTNLHWPHNYVPNCVCYTGTHDNDTVNGWYTTLNEHDRNYLALTLGKTVGDPAWDLLWLAWESVAALAVAPLQDVLGLGSAARMNRPGVPTGNWRWRFRLDHFRAEVIHRLAEITTLYNRVPGAHRPG